jgi:hypothetical protein
MPRVEGVPMSAQIGFEPGAKIHRTRYRRDLGESDSNDYTIVGA